MAGLNQSGSSWHEQESVHASWFPQLVAHLVVSPPFRGKTIKAGATNCKNMEEAPPQVSPSALAFDPLNSHAQRGGGVRLSVRSTHTSFWQLAELQFSEGGCFVDFACRPSTIKIFFRLYDVDCFCTAQPGRELQQILWLP